MDISSNKLLTLTYRKNINVADIALNGNVVDGYNQVQINEENLAYNSNVLKTAEEKCINILSDTVSIGGKNVDIFGDISDAQVEEIYNKVLKVQSDVPEKLTTTYSDLSPKEISDIKKAVYSVHNAIPEELHLPSGTAFPVPKRLAIGTSTPTDPDPEEPGTVHIGGDDTGGTGDDTGGPSSGDTSTKTTFLKNQYASIVDTDSMFTYFNNIDSSITKSTGITRAQLVSFTQEDDYEDGNYDFFGTINRIFNVLDKDSNNKLTASEIETFIENELGTDVSAYLSKVNSYAAEIQTYYSGLSNQKKLEYVLERTKEYLEAAGLTKQVQALNRLKSETDTANSGAVAKVGQIVMVDLNPGYTGGPFTLGAYSNSAYVPPEGYDYVTENGEKYDVSIWASDNDISGQDYGITLDKTLLDDNWYELVDTLVHELTHATAYLYAGTDLSGYYDFSLFNFDEVTNMYNDGIMSSTEYNWYKNNWNNPTPPNDKIVRLMYLVECRRGEYAAYQVDADYVDSIAGDVLDGTSVLSMAVNGNQEKSTIENHVYKYYDNYGEEEYLQAYPDYKWWTYRGALA